jgi:hypothetical protein
MAWPGMLLSECVLFGHMAFAACGTPDPKLVFNVLVTEACKVTCSAIRIH